MALFPKGRQSRKPPMGRPSYRRVIVIEGQPRRAAFLKRLDVLCHNTAAHPLPVKMKCLSEGTSAQGHPMAIYACPFHGCPWREGWVQKRLTGKPFRLWAGLHNGR